jgi:hypothetical protein
MRLNLCKIICVCVICILQCNQIFDVKVTGKNNIRTKHLMVIYYVQQKVSANIVPAKMLEENSLEQKYPPPQKEPFPSCLFICSCSA